MTKQELQALYREAQGLGFDSDGVRARAHAPQVIAKHFGIAFDAVTLPNTSIPADYATFLDPRVIDVFFAPTVSKEIAPLFKAGSFGDEFYRNRIREAVGRTRPYNDYSTEQTVNSNNNWDYRDAYYMEAVNQYGDKEVATSARALIDVVADQELATATIIDQDLNNIAFFGLAGQRTYGILNEPQRAANLTPSGGTSWAAKTMEQVVADITAIITRLYENSKGRINRNSKLVITMSPKISGLLLGKISSFGYSVEKWLKDSVGNANITDVIIAPQYSTSGGELVDVGCKDMLGQDVWNSLFGELYKSHGVHRELSSFSEKVSAISYGALLRYPFAVQGMLGV